MKVSNKGQITIPRAIGRRHGLLPNQEVKLVEQPNGVLVTTAAKSALGKRVVATLLRGGRVKGCTKDWLRETRG